MKQTMGAQIGLRMKRAQIGLRMKLRKEWLKALYGLGAMVPSVMRGTADAEDVARAVARVESCGQQLVLRTAVAVTKDTAVRKTKNCRPQDCGPQNRKRD